MRIIPAAGNDLETVLGITYTTINAVYPHYYPAGAVGFFIAHHSSENVLRDIKAGKVFLLYDDSGTAAGTVTVDAREINRLFVLPEYQGKGFGGELLRFAEERIALMYSSAELSASLPAKAIYLKKGYHITEYHIIDTPDGDFLCYDLMEKKLRD